MKLQRILISIFLFLPIYSVQAQTSLGAEVVSYNTFGEGVMVTRAKMVPISGTVSNIFFYNRADEPWNGNVWYEYDWELRGAHPYGGWSQIRVRENNGGQLEDAPINLTMSENLSEKLLHYILIRQGTQYIYDVRESFDINTYDYTIAGVHDGNSASIIIGGPRIFTTGDSVANIPESKRLDFSLGITAFDSNWTGSLPSGNYSGDYVVDFTRFYEFSGESLNTTPQWQDEFNDDYLDSSKWFAANWVYAETQFTPDNIRFENGYMILRIEREEDSFDTINTNLASLGEASQSSDAYGGLANRAIDGNTNGRYSKKSVTHTSNEPNAWWELDLLQVSNISQIVIYNRTDNCCVNRLSDFSVSILDENDNVIWTQFYTESPQSILEINLSVTAKKIRINLDGILSLAEVEVYGD